MSIDSSIQRRRWVDLGHDLAVGSDPMDGHSARIVVRDQNMRAGRIRKIGLERIDGEPVFGGPFGELLVELGFRQSPRALTLSA